MNFNGKRAQGATEYLIILAVVIVIALIVIGVLGGIPGIGDTSGQQAAESYWATTDIAIDDYYLGAGADRLILTAKNNQEDTVKIISIKTGSVTNDSVKILSPGGSAEFSFAQTCANQGDAFDYETIVTYQDTVTLANYTFTGTVNLVGECSQ
jgi:type II secretory pathway pseudopilin PulG